MYKLEHDVEDKKKAQSITPVLQNLFELSNDYWKDDYASSQSLRKKFREEKKLRISEEKKDQLLIEKAGLAIPLVKEQSMDIHLAKMMPFASSKSKLP
jgi:coiled-coil domain-containing protein 130